MGSAGVGAAGGGAATGAGVWGGGLLSSGRRCNREMKVCYHLMNLLLGLLELVGELLVGAVKVCHRLSLFSRGLAVGGGSGG